MQNPNIYTPHGKVLRRVTASTGNVIALPETTSIPVNGFSEIISSHDCLELTFEFIFPAAASGDVVIEECIDETASVAGETHDTWTATTERVGKWPGTRSPGLYRIQNTSDQAVTVYPQKRTA